MPTRQVFISEWFVDRAVANKMNFIFLHSFAVSAKNAHLQVLIAACFFYPVLFLSCVR